MNETSKELSYTYVANNGMTKERGYIPNPRIVTDLIDLVDNIEKVL